MLSGRGWVGMQPCKPGPPRPTAWALERVGVGAKSVHDPNVSDEPGHAVPLSAFEPAQFVVLDERFRVARRNPGEPQAHDVPLGDKPSAVIGPDEFGTEFYADAQRAR